MVDKSKVKVIYASDLDRTIIYSDRFINEHKTDAKYTPVEKKDGKVISNLADSVKSELKNVNDSKNVVFIPVTSRSVEEYKRVDLGFTPKYAIVDNGGTILVDGMPMLVYQSHIQELVAPAIAESAIIMLDIIEHNYILGKEPKLIDNLFLFWKVKDGHEEEADVLINELNATYTKWEFTRQRKKVYGVPVCFSKQVALRWLWGQLGKPYMVVSGDGEMDLPMLTLANKAIIPSHSDLLKEGFVESADVADGGIESPLKAINYVKRMAEV